MLVDKCRGGQRGLFRSIWAGNAAVQRISVLRHLAVAAPPVAINAAESRCGVGFAAVLAQPL
jgi:hypothetical protein